MKDIGIIGSADGPTSIIVSESVENIEEFDLDARLDSKSIQENLDSGVKIMGIGMAAVFGVLTILYIIIKIMGAFAKGKNKDK